MKILKILYIALAVFWLLMFLLLDFKLIYLLASLVCLALGLVNWKKLLEYKPNPKPEPKAEEKPVVKQSRYQYEDLPIYDQDKEVIRDFYSFYNDEFEEQEEYDLSKEDFLANVYDRAFRFKPFTTELFEVKGNNVYVFIDGKYYKVGRLDDEDLDEYELADYSCLKFFEGSYKTAEDGKVKRHKYDSYFKLTTKKRLD